MFKSQRIQSMSESGQFLKTSRQLSNSCIYSGQEEKFIVGNRNQSNEKKFTQSYQNPNTFESMDE